MTRLDRIACLALAAGLLVPALPAAAQTQVNKKDTHAQASSAAEVTSAVSLLVPVGDSGVRGIVRFAQQGDKVKVRGRIVGLTPGKHGFHVHQYGDLTDLKEGKSAGDHFNPEEKPHGKRDDQQRHAGDFGNIEANQEGVAEFEFEDAMIRLSGPHSIIGRGLVVHADEDKFTQPSGDAGDRVALGVIGAAAEQAAE